MAPASAAPPAPARSRPSAAYAKSRIDVARRAADIFAAQCSGDPELVAACTPDYPAFCKRVVIDNDWFRTLQRPDVELQDSAADPIVQVRGRAGGGAETPAAAVAGGARAEQREAGGVESGHMAESSKKMYGRNLRHSGIFDNLEYPVTQ